MHARKIFISMILMAFLVVSGQAGASDLAKEKRWADQVVDAIIDGEAVWLQNNDTKFLGIFTENYAEKSLGAAIILHGIGVHPNWPDVVQPLRTELPNHGWATLSIQMPILPNDAKETEYDPLFPEVPGRVSAAVAFLQSKGIRNIVVVGHSLGGKMAAYYMASGKPPVAAMVTVGPQIRLESSVHYGDLLSKVNTPILDIYGSQDLEAVLNSATDRALAARKAGNKDYRQIMVPGANHFFQGSEADLIRHVKGWLSKNVGGVEVKMQNKSK